MCVHLKWDHLVSDTMWNNVSVVCGVCLQWSPTQPNPTVTVHRPLNDREIWRAPFRHTRVSSQWNACFAYLSIHKMVPPVWCQILSLNRVWNWRCHITAATVTLHCTDLWDKDEQISPSSKKSTLETTHSFAIFTDSRKPFLLSMTCWHS